MGRAHRFTTIQLTTLLIAAAAVGACSTLIVAASARAGAATVGLLESKTAPVDTNLPVEKAVGRPVVHFEIGCRDSAKTRDFYSKLFDWQIKTEGPSTVIHTGGKKGIDGHITALGHDPQNYVTVYVEVEDIKAYLDKATALGGKTLVPAIKIPTGHFAWIADPDGNIVGLIQQKKP